MLNYQRVMNVNGVYRYIKQFGKLGVPTKQGCGGTMWNLGDICLANFGGIQWDLALFFAWE
jgi:hypothetical protein